MTNIRLLAESEHENRSMRELHEDADSIDDNLVPEHLLIKGRATIKNRHMFLCRLGFMPPKVTSPACRHSYFDGILEQKTTCHRMWVSAYWPNGKLGNPRQCLFNPTKDELYAELIKIQTASNGKIFFDLDPRNLPDRDWLIMELATNEPDHNFFKRLKPTVE